MRDLADGWHRLVRGACAAWVLIGSTVCAATDAPQLMVQSGHADVIDLVSSISPDGRLVATAAGDSLKVWSADVGRLVCALPLRPHGRQAPPGADRDADDERARSMAWSADGRSLLVPIGGTTLQRFDLRRCAADGQLTLALPALPPLPRRESDDPLDEREIEQVSNLANGLLLVRTEAALWQLRADQPAQVPSLLADLRPGAVAAVANAQPSARRGLAAFLEQTLDLPRGRTIGAHSTDGRVVVLVAQMLVYGPLVLPASTAEPLVVTPEGQRPLSSFQGADRSYRGVSVAAVSASGRWVAVRHSSPGGAVVSLFDVPGRRLVHTVRFSVEGGPKAQFGPLDAVFKPLLGPGLEQIGAVAGLAFSRDEQQLAVLRPRTEAGEGQADDPTLELRSVDGLRVLRRVPLTGGFVAQGGVGTGLSGSGGNGLTPSADHQALSLQSVSITRGSWMAAWRWGGAEPELNTWSATEGRVVSLAFADDRQLLSVQSMMQLPSADGGAPPALPAGSAMNPALMLAAVSQAQQVLRWSFDAGEATTLHTGLALAAKSLGSLTDPAGQRLLHHTTRLAGPGTAEQALVMRDLRNGTELWRQAFNQPDGAPRQPMAIAVSRDWSLVAAVVQRNAPPRAGGGNGAGPVSGAGAPADAGRPVADAAPPAAATASAADGRTPSRPGGAIERALGGVMGVLRGAIEGAVRGDRSPAPPPTSGQPAAVPADGSGRAGAPADRQLVLLDAATGAVRGRLNLRKTAGSGGEVLQFVAGPRLLVDDQLVDLVAEPAGTRLGTSRARALNGPLLGVTPESGRPILARGSADASLRAVVLPAAHARATLAQASRDDRLLAVLTDGMVTVLDVQQGFRPVFSADLDGSPGTAMALSPSGTVLAVGTAQGAVRLFDLRRQRPLATLLGLSDGSWAAVDPEGRFDASNLGNNPALHWVMPDDPLRPLPFELAMGAYYTPRLLPLLLDDAARLPAVAPLQSISRVAPRVSVDRIEPMPGRPGQVRVQVSVAAQTDARGQASGASDLRLFRNGRLVGHAPAADGPLPLDAAGRFTQVFEGVRLPDGTAPVVFTAYAFNTGGMRSAIASQRWVAADTAPPRPRRAFVVAVGANRYASPAWSPLAYAVNDARLMHDMLLARLRATGDYAEVAGVLLASDMSGRDDATKARLAAAIGLLAGRPDARGALAGVAGADRLAAATPADLVVISFAGHGYVSERGGELHLVPSDIAADATAPAGAAGEGDGLWRFDARAISALELERWLRDVDAGQMTLVVDACRSAAAVSESFKAGPMGSRGLGQLAFDKGARILTATQAADDAMEFASLRHGLLSFALLEEGLRGGQADFRPADRRIDAGEWLAFAAARVPSLHALLNQGGAPLTVAGRQWTSGRAALRPPPVGPGAIVPAGQAGGGATGAAAVVGPGARPRVQVPKLFDFVPRDPAPALIGRLP